MERAEQAAIDTQIRDRELRALADTTRRLMAAVVRTGEDAAALAAVRERLDEAAAALERSEDGDFVLVPVSAWSEGGPVRSFNPVVGGCNPIAAPVRIERVDPPAIVGTVTLGAVYEGPPGYVHGGIVSLLFDQLLGLANSTSGNGGMTVSLSIRYHRPTPLHTPLRLEARHNGVNGRKITASGALYAGDELTCTAEGLFLGLHPEQREELFSPRLGGSVTGRSWS